MNINHSLESHCPCPRATIEAHDSASTTRHQSADPSLASANRDYFDFGRRLLWGLRGILDWRAFNVTRYLVGIGKDEGLHDNNSALKVSKLQFGSSIFSWAGERAIMQIELLYASEIQRRLITPLPLEILSKMSEFRDIEARTARYH